MTWLTNIPIHHILIELPIYHFIIIMIIQPNIQISVPDASIHESWYAIWVIECLHLHWNLNNHLKDHDHDFDDGWIIFDRPINQQRKTTTGIVFDSEPKFLGWLSKFPVSYRIRIPSLIPSYPMIHGLSKVVRSNRPTSSKEMRNQKPCFLFFSTCKPYYCKLFRVNIFRRTIVSLQYMYLEDFEVYKSKEEVFRTCSPNIWSPIWDSSGDKGPFFFLSRSAGKFWNRLKTAWHKGTLLLKSNCSMYHIFLLQPVL